MKSVDGFKYVGLTDRPSKKRKLHGNPSDWVIREKFDSEDDARFWLSTKIKLPGYTGGNDNDGWRYGYMYTIAGDME